MINFRGKSLFGRHEWLYGSLLSLNGKCYICPSASNKWNMTEYEVIPETIGSTTDLYDREKEEIYDGDILKIEIKVGIPNIGASHSIGDLFVVKKLLSGFTLISMIDWKYENRRNTSSLSRNLDNYFLWNNARNFTTVGNIYDNEGLTK